MRRNTNPNARINEIKERFGATCNYGFMIWDNLQREFFLEMQRREKERKKGKR